MRRHDPYEIDIDLLISLYIYSIQQKWETEIQVIMSLLEYFALDDEILTLFDNCCWYIVFVGLVTTVSDRSGTLWCITGISC